MEEEVVSATLPQVQKTAQSKMSRRKNTIFQQPVQIFIRIYTGKIFQVRKLSELG